MNNYQLVISNDQLSLLGTLVVLGLVAEVFGFWSLSKGKFPLLSCSSVSISTGLSIP